MLERIRERERERAKSLANIKKCSVIFGDVVSQSARFSRAVYALYI